MSDQFEKRINAELAIAKDRWNLSEMQVSEIKTHVLARNAFINERVLIMAESFKYQLDKNIAQFLVGTS